MVSKHDRFKKRNLYFRMIITDENITFLDKLTHLGQARLLRAILKRVNKETMCWTNHKIERTEICNTIRIDDKPLSEISYQRHLAHLTKEGILLKIAKGSYKVNPIYIAFGKEE